ncbi:acylphosphatase [bacterium 1xD8-6]|nr:acylphosphatase [bacterium D16-36]RKI72591.1 acylphosphatase [bacterium 1xD8-6]
MEKIRKEYRFTGRVQGVGFRYHAYHTAQRLGITGWVQNCYDGSVAAQAQGHPDALQDFKALLGQGRYIVIDAVEEREIPVDGEERGFRILH